MLIFSYNISHIKYFCNYINEKQRLHMLKIHYCPNCHRITYTHYIKCICRTCNIECKNLDIEFEKFFSMTKSEREEYIDSQLHN